jgi:hypothetical protein
MKRVERNKVLKMWQYFHHQMYVSIDLDNFVAGFPEVNVWPKHGETTFKLPLTLNLMYVKNKKAISIVR